MVIGVGRLELDLPFAHSLKTKRQVVRKILDRVRSRFNACAAEVSNNDVWQRASIGLAVLGNDSGHVDSMLASVFNFIDRMQLAPVLDWSTELIHMGDESPGLPMSSEDEF